MKLHAQHRLQSLQRVFPNAHHVARLQNKFGITSNYSSWCAVHWDGKFLHDVTGIDMNKVHRLPVLVTSLVDENTQASLLESKKLASGSGKPAGDPVFHLIKLWQYDHLVCASIQPHQTLVEQM